MIKVVGRGALVSFAWILLHLQGCAPLMESEDISKLLRGSTFDRVGDYKIGSADVLTIKVFGEESLSGQYTVAPSGNIQFPLVGFVTAEGLGQTQLAQHLEQVLKPFIKNSHVAVSVSESKSFNVFFSGEFQTRGAKDLRAKTTILQGVILTGGLTDFATGRIYLIRQVGDGEVKRYKTTFKNLLKGQKIVDFLYLERGDIIHAE